MGGKGSFGLAGGLQFTGRTNPKRNPCVSWLVSLQLEQVLGIFCLVIVVAVGEP